MVFLLLPLAPPLLGLLLAAGALPATEPLAPQVPHPLPLTAGPLPAAAALTPPEPPVLRLVPLVVAPLPVTAPLALQAPLPLGRRSQTSFAADLRNCARAPLGGPRRA